MTPNFWRGFSAGIIVCMVVAVVAGFVGYALGGGL